MLEYYLAVLIILIVMLGSLIGYYKPFIGIITMILGCVFLIPLAINPTVIIGIGYSSSGQTTLTVQIIELRIFSIIVLLINCATTIIGFLKGYEG